MQQEEQSATNSLAGLLLALADDEFITGYANSEWTGIAPLLEEDLAFSSLAQDELGHAALLYGLLAELLGADADALAYARPPEQFRHAQLAERPRGDWAYSVTRQLLYDTAEHVRLASLAGSSYAPLAQAAAAMLREERYHLLHAHTWLERLAAGGAESRRRQVAALEALWPDALGLFEPLPGEPELLAAGIMPEPNQQLQQSWLAALAEPLRRLGLPWPFVEAAGGWRALLPPRYGGRAGRHSPEFLVLHDTITSVYRSEPGARW